MPPQIDNRLLSRDAKPNSFTYHSPNHSWVVSPITKPLALTGEESNHRLCYSHFVLLALQCCLKRRAFSPKLMDLFPRPLESDLSGRVSNLRN